MQLRGCVHISKRLAMPGRVFVAPLSSPSPPPTGHKTMQKGWVLGLNQGSHRQKGYRMEVPPPVKEVGVRTEMTFTIKSLVLFLFVEEPWRMKLRLNVFVLVTEDTAIFSAERKQMRMSPRAGLTVKEERPGVQIAQACVLDLESHSGPWV